MGADSSKHVEPPTEWEARANQFQIISPSSDISNPSDIRKINHHQGHTATHDRRRTSRVVTNDLRKSSKQVPAPSTFYFPTKESEKQTERAIKKSSTSRQKEGRQQKQSKKTNGKENRVQSVKGFKKTRKNVQKKFAGCFEENAHHKQDIEADAPQTKTENRRRTSKQGTKKQQEMIILDEVPTKQKTRRSSVSSTREQRSKVVRQEKRASKKKTDNAERDPGAKKDRSDGDVKKRMSSSNGEFVLPEAAMMPDAYRTSAPPQQKFSAHIPTPAQETLPEAEIGLHQEDAYFTRLAAEVSGLSDIENSSFAAPQATANHNANSKMVIPSMLDATVKNVPDPQMSPSPRDDSNDIHVDEAKRETKYSEAKASQSQASEFTNYNNVSALAVQASNAAKLFETTQTSKSPTALNKPQQRALSSPVDDLVRFQLQSKELHQADLNEEPVELWLDETSEDSPRQEQPLGSIEENQVKLRTDQSENNSPSQSSGTASKVSSVTMGTTSYGSFEHQEKSLDKSGDDSGIQQDQPSNGSTEKKHFSDDASSIASGDNTYFKPGEMINSESAFRPRTTLHKEPIKQIASLGPNSKSRAPHKASKLEKLFRPILPAFSADDVESNAGSYDPYEIRVTESAPSMIGSKDYRAIAMPSKDVSPVLDTKKKMDMLAICSPSLLSIDSQALESPSLAKDMVSDQAQYNAEFLFSSNYGKELILKHTSKDVRRDSDMFSISTIGARSRLSKGSTRAKAVNIPVRSSQSVVSRGSQSVVSRGSQSVASRGSQSVVSRESSKSSREERRVRFSGDEAPRAPRSRGSIESSLSGSNSVKGIVLPPAIESTVSDLTDNLSEIGYAPHIESSKMDNRYTPIKEELLESESATVVTKEMHELESSHAPSEENTSPAIANWSYRGADGNLSAVTPHLKGKPISNATNSPFLRFRAAKSKFANPAEAKKEVPVKKATPTKPKRRKSNGIVSARIDELNKRVSALRRKRTSSSSGTSRLSEGSCSNMIRTPAIMSYKFDAPGVNAVCMSDNSSVEETSTTSGELGTFCSTAQTADLIIDEGDEEDEEDELSETMTRLSEGSATVATVRQERGDVFIQAGFSRSRMSEGTFSSASSGLSTVRKQVFRPSSILSSDSASYHSHASTTLSSIMDKENATYLPFRTGANLVKPSEQHRHQHKAPAAPELELSPTQRTPMQARKWRSLRAAVQEKDSRSSRKAGSGAGRPRKGLSDRTNIRNGLAYVR